MVNCRRVEVDRQLLRGHMMSDDVRHGRIRYSRVQMAKSIRRGWVVAAEELRLTKMLVVVWNHSVHRRCVCNAKIVAETIHWLAGWSDFLCYVSEVGKPNVTQSPTLEFCMEYKHRR